jgi:methyl-accepting chemotaxis protein
MNLNHLTIGSRIAGLAACLMLAAILMGVMTWFVLKADTNQFESSHATADQFEKAIDQARGAQVTFKVQIQEWKNLLLRGGNPESFDKYSKAFAKEGQATQVKLAELKKLFTQLGLESQGLDEAQAALQNLTLKYTAALAQYDKADPDKSAHVVDALVKGLDRPPTQKIDEIVSKVLKASDANRTDGLARAQARAQSTLMAVLAVLATTITAGTWASWLILKSITRPLQQAVQAANDVSQGKLKSKLSALGRDEISQLMRAMSLMSENLHRVVSQVRESSQTVAHASTEIATGNMDLSTRTETQASKLQQTAATIEQLSGDINLSADHATQAQSLANTASQAAERGSTVVSHVVQTMSDINASSRKISEIIGVIDGIAFQTNILALNAAVEAARAGEQGRGFAVVASEVRALAQRSANAAKEIKTLINDSVQCVDRGTALVGEAGDTITSAMDAVRHVRDMISEITAATSQQASGISEVSHSIGAIDNTMQQNAALVEQAAAAATSLKQQADALHESVAFFEI